MPGKGRMQITGKLGDVMQESVKAAKSFVDQNVWNTESFLHI